MEASDKRRLRARAHHLKPVVLLGQHGLTEAVFAEIDIALSHHELIKIRVNANDREERNTMIQEICTRLNSQLVQRIGHVATLYRENPQD